MSNITTIEQAEAMQAAYRASCTTRRRGHLIEEKQGDEWVITFDGSEGLSEKQAGAQGINRAKRKMRGSAGTAYVV